MTLEQALRAIFTDETYNELIRRGLSEPRLVVDAAIIAFLNDRKDEAASVVRRTLASDFKRIMERTQKQK